MRINSFPPHSINHLTLFSQAPPVSNLLVDGYHFLTVVIERHRLLTVMIGTDLQGFVSPHQDSDRSLLFVF